MAWSSSKLADVLNDDGDDVAKKKEFLSPTITSCLCVEGVGPQPEHFYLPICIDTLLQKVYVWWPSQAATLWNGEKLGEGGHADSIRAMIRIDTIVGGDWDLATFVVHTGGATASPWSPRRVSLWAASFSPPKLTA